MEPNDVNLDNDLEETAGSEEEIKSGLKIRTNLKAGGALTVGSRIASGPGMSISEVALAGPQLNVNVLAGAVKY